MNPYELAVEQASAGRTWFGKCDVFAEVVFFAGGGARPVPWDENIHPLSRANVNTEFTLLPIDNHETTFTPRPQSFVSFTSEWKKIVWPSIQALGLPHAGELDGKWVKVEEVITGETESKKTGKVYDDIAYKFLEIFSNEEECVAAFVAERGQPVVKASDPAADVDMSSSTAPIAVNPATALAFLPALIGQANGDMAALDNLLSQTPVILDFGWTHQSPEVRELLIASATA